MLPSNVREQITRISQVGFVRSVAMLVGGTAVAQVIWFAATPVLTRLYSPADFSFFGAFVALMSMLSIVACLGYDNAIVVPEKDEDAASLLSLSLVLSVTTSGAALALVVLSPAPLAWLLAPLHPYEWAVPLVVLPSAAFSAIQFWASRRKQFGSVARVRVAQASTGVVTQIGAGIAGLVPGGLVAGQAMNFIVGVAMLGRRALREVGADVEAMQVKAMGAVASRYRDFAIMTTPALLANSAAVQVPVLVVASAGKIAEAGFLFLAMRVMQAPLATIGSAVSQVYYTESPAAWREGRLPQLTCDVIKRLSQVGIGPLVFAGIAGRPIFEIVFGPGWGRAGEIVAWMVPWLALQFIASPISMLLYALERQRTDLMIQVFGVIVRVGPVLVAARVAPAWLPEVFAVTGAVFYAGYLFVLRRVVGLSWRDLGSAMASAKWLVLAWTVFALLVRFGAHAMGLVDT